MFKHLLIPLDLTEKHQRVLEIGAGLAQQAGGTITLLHVIEEIPGLAQEEVADFYEKLQEKATAHLHYLGEHFNKANIPWQSQVLVGPRIQEITRFATEKNIDLILVTAPKIDPDHPGTSWASLSWKIGLLAHCPVLLVK